MLQSACSDLTLTSEDTIVSACSWMTHLINGGVSKVDNEAMQLLKSILPDKIIARIQGVGFRQRFAAVTLPRPRKHAMPQASIRTCTGVFHACHNDKALQQNFEGLALSLQGQKFIADSHQRVTVMFSGEVLWGQCIAFLQHNLARKPLCWLWLAVHSSISVAGLPAGSPSASLQPVSRCCFDNAAATGAVAHRAHSCCRHCRFHPTQLQSSHS